MNLIPTTAALVLAGALLTAPAHAGNDRVCPHTDGWVKYDGLSGHSFAYPEVVPEGAAVENCVKYATNVDYGTGTTVTSDGKHEISHASFRVTPVTPEPDPQPDPEPEVLAPEPETPAEDPEEPRDAPKPHTPIGLPRDKAPLGEPSHSVPPRTSSLSVECIGGALVKRITDADGGSETSILNGHRACPQVDAAGGWFKETGL